MNPSNAYVPGVCNIGGSEITFRKAVGWVGLLSTVGLLVFFCITPVEPALRLILGATAFTAALGLLQARQRFCINYGMMGRYNLGPGASGGVQSPEERSADRKTSLRILGLSLLAAAAGCLVGYFLPV